MKNYLSYIGALLILTIPFSTANANINYMEKYKQQYEKREQRNQRAHNPFPVINPLLPLELMIEAPLPPAKFMQPTQPQEEEPKEAKRTQEKADTTEHNLLKEYRDKQEHNLLKEYKNRQK